MIRLRTILSLSVVSVFLHAEAVTSPYSSLDDFAFTRPLFTNLIKGVVMGTEDSYATVRYEDFAFLEEALAERILSTTEMSHESFTNLVSATNSTLSSVAITGPRYYLIGSMLDPELVLSDKPRLVYSTANDVNNETNFLETKTLLLRTNEYNHIEKITQLMKSGELDVFTNRFAVSFKSNVYDRVHLSTNWFNQTHAHFCTENALKRIDENLDIQTNILVHLYAPWYSKTAVQKNFELMRLSNRPAPKDGSLNLDNVISDSISTYNDENPVYRKITNSIYRISVSHTKNYSELQIETDEGWESDGEPNVIETTSNLALIPDFSKNVITTHLPFDILSYKMEDGRRRFDYVDAYSSAFIGYSTSEYSYHSTSDGAKTDVSFNTNFDALVIFPLGRFNDFQSDTNEMLTITTDISIPYQEICSLSGIQFLDETMTTDLPAVESPEWLGVSETRTKQTYQSKHKVLHVSLSDAVFLFFHLTPKSTLQEWN